MAGLVGFVALETLPLSRGAKILSRMLDAFEVPPSYGRSSVSGDGFGLGLRAPSSHTTYRSPQGDFALAQTGAQAELGGRSTDRIRRLFRDHGSSLGRQLEGPYGLALWDGQAMYLFRDGLGLESLVWGWAEQPRMLLFASEAKPILASGVVQPTFDRRAVLDVLSVGHPVPPRTLFSGLRQLSPGACLKIDLRGQLEQRLEDPVPFPDLGSSAHQPARAAKEQLKQALVTSTGQPRAEERGIHLEGGPASALLAALQRERTSSHPVLTFGERFNSVLEKDWRADRVESLAETLETEHAEIVHRPSGRERVLRMVRACESPILFPSDFFRSYLYEGVAASGCAVLQSSTGAGFVAGLDRYLPQPAGPGWILTLWNRLRYRNYPGLARAIGRSHGYRRSLRRRWGMAPGRLERWLQRAHLADALFLATPGPPGLARLPQALEAPPHLIEGEWHRRRALDLQLGQLAHGIQVEKRMAASFGLSLDHPYLSRAPVEVSLQHEPERALHWVRQLLPKPLSRLRTNPSSLHQTLWPFGPGMDLWVKEALSEPKLARVAGMNAESVSRSLDRMAQPSSDPGRVVEAEVLRALLGLSLLAESVGVNAPALSR